MCHSGCSEATSLRVVPVHVASPECYPGPSPLKSPSNAQPMRARSKPHTSGSRETERLRGVMPRLMDALSFFIDAPNFVRSCGREGLVSWAGEKGSSVTERLCRRSQAGEARQDARAGSLLYKSQGRTHARAQANRAVQQQASCGVVSFTVRRPGVWRSPQAGCEGQAANVGGWMRAFSLASLSLTAPMSSFGSTVGRPDMLAQRP